MTDQSFGDTEQRLRAALTTLAEAHRPAMDRRWIAAETGVEQRPSPPSSTRRWVLAAASIVVIAGGLAAVAVVQRGGGDPATVTSPTEPPGSAPATVLGDELGSVRFPVDAPEQDAQWMVPWADGFLVGEIDEATDAGGEPSMRARFTTDGADWEPVEMSMPPGVRVASRVTSVGDRFVVAAYVEPTETADVIRVASTTDLLNWSVQDFEVPGRRSHAAQSELGGSFPSMRSFAANENGWVFEIERVYSDDVTVVLPEDVKSQLVPGGYRIRSDEDGFTVTVNEAAGSPPATASTFEYSWAEVGVSPDAVPYLTGEIPSSRTWTATWSGTPVVADTADPGGPTLASSEGFVRWNDHTWFSADGGTWTASALPDPTGAVQSAFPVDDGFVAIVGNQDGTSDVYHLDQRGGSPRRIDVDGLPERFRTTFPEQALVGSSSATSAVVLYAAASGDGLAPLVIDSGGYRYVERSTSIAVIDLATGEVVLSAARNRAPAADTVLEVDADGITITDPVTEVVLMEIPHEAYRAAQNSARGTVGADATGEVADLRLLASRDGRRFLVETVGSDEPATASDMGIVHLATNAGAVLARVDDEWIRFHLPS